MDAPAGPALLGPRKSIAAVFPAPARSLARSRRAPFTRRDDLPVRRECSRSSPPASGRQVTVDIRGKRPGDVKCSARRRLPVGGPGRRDVSVQLADGSRSPVRRMLFVGPLTAHHLTSRLVCIPPRDHARNDNRWRALSHLGHRSADRKAPISRVAIDRPRAERKSK